MFTESDLEQLKKRNVSIEQVNAQIDSFKKGFPFLDIIKPATVGNGILRLNEEHIKTFVDLYETEKSNFKIIKFTPASGAATRMFKDLFDFINKLGSESYSTEEHFKSAKLKAVWELISKLDKIAFYHDLEKAFSKEGKSLASLIENKEYKTIIEKILHANGLNYGNLPKGILKFHQYADGAHTPVEEHFAEGINYAQVDGKVNLHFTISPEHKSAFESLVSDLRNKYENDLNIKIEVGFSEQKSSTDTLAVDLNNEPFRNADGSLLFRPGGHGALIENLNEIDADIIFVKNIDNVVPVSYAETTYQYKKALAGVLLNYQQKIKDYLLQLSSQSGQSTSLLEEIGSFVHDELCILPPMEFEPKTKEEQCQYLISKLKRPIRVCGMVKNEGEPGGGPFWATNPDGTVSLQIAESSQIDQKDAIKAEIANAATHFNPVDLVCFVKNFNGEKFDLTKFTDPGTGFISEKSKDGKSLKALELPGLWNGAMSNWITIFVEVPVATFNPVKTVNDLLRTEHQY